MQFNDCERLATSCNSSPGDQTYSPNPRQWKVRCVWYALVLASGIEGCLPTMVISQSTALCCFPFRLTGMRSVRPSVLAKVESSSTVTTSRSFVGVRPAPMTGIVLRLLCKPVQPTNMDRCTGLSFFFAPACGIDVYCSSATTSWTSTLFFTSVSTRGPGRLTRQFFNGWRDSSALKGILAFCGVEGAMSGTVWRRKLRSCKVKEVLEYAFDILACDAEAVGALSMDTTFARTLPSVLTPCSRAYSLSLNQYILLSLPNLTMSSSSTPSPIDKLPSPAEVEQAAVEATKSSLQSLRSLVAGGAGGVCAVLVGHPFDLVKVRLQTADKGVYNGAIDVVRQIVGREGAKVCLISSCL